MNEVYLYKKPSCVQCDMTEKWLAARGVHYHKVDVTESEEAYAYVTSLGYLQAPVVVVRKLDDIVHWSGFIPDMLKQHLED